MNQFSAEGFYELGKTLQVLRSTAKEYQANNPAAVLGEDENALFQKYLTSALDLANQVGLKIAAKVILDARVKQGVRYDFVSNRITTIGEIIEKEMDGQLFLYVPSTRSEFYERDAVEFLGDKGRDRFPSTLPEIDEAMKCYSVGRYTGCAFHLMRATEAGTKALGIALGAKVRGNNWGEVFDEHDRQLALPPASRPPHWATYGDFLKDIAADLRSVKVLRNGVAHLDESYTEERAAKLLVMVPEFIRKMAEKMDETGKLL